MYSQIYSSYTRSVLMILFFFFNDTATTEIYTLSLHDALPIFDPRHGFAQVRPRLDRHLDARLAQCALQLASQAGQSLARQGLRILRRGGISQHHAHHLAQMRSLQRSAVAAKVQRVAPALWSRPRWSLAVRRKALPGRTAPPAGPLLLPNPVSGSARADGTSGPSPGFARIEPCREWARRNA